MSPMLSDDGQVQPTRFSYQSPRGGQLVGETLSLFDTTCPPGPTCSPGVLIEDNSAPIVTITPSFLGSDPTLSSGTVSYSLRSPTDVPEPSTMLDSLALGALLGSGFVLRHQQKKQQQLIAEKLIGNKYSFNFW